MKPTQTNIMRILGLLDWGGHVELSQNDWLWLSGELSLRLQKTDDQICDSCNKVVPLVVATSLGNVCDACINQAQIDLASMRDALED